MESQAKNMKKEYDNLVYNNNMLAKKLKQLKTIQTNEGGGDLTKNDGETKVQTIQKKVECCVHIFRLMNCEN
jgi:hypothetical protein